jgi:hypothetical protein
LTMLKLKKAQTSALQNTCATMDFFQLNNQLFSMNLDVPVVILFSTHEGSDGIHSDFWNSDDCDADLLGGNDPER